MTPAERPEVAAGDAIVLAETIGLHNMLSDGRCDCGDHDDWPMKMTWCDHVADELVRLGWRQRAAAAEPLRGALATVEQIMDAEHRYCVEAEGEWALSHDVERHRRQAAFVRAALEATAPSTPEPALDVERPEVVVLCGSTRFYEEFQQANYDLTMAGKIVLSVGFYPHSKAEHGHGEGVGHDSAEKVALDELHKRKIDLADRVLVLNVGGYIGASTRGEIEYAEARGKPIDYKYAALTSEPRAAAPQPECWCGLDSSLNGARSSIVCPKHDGDFTVPR